jgi:hypothetical protein
MSQSERRLDEAVSRIKNLPDGSRKEMIIKAVVNYINGVMGYG